MDKRTPSHKKKIAQNGENKPLDTGKNRNDDRIGIAKRQETLGTESKDKGLLSFGRAFKRNRKSASIKDAPFSRSYKVSNRVVGKTYEQDVISDERPRRQATFAFTERKFKHDAIKGADKEIIARKKKRKTREISALERLRANIDNLGYVCIEIYGENAVRGISAISKICTVRSVKRLDDGMTFRVEGKQCDKIIALLDNLCYDYKIISVGGFAPVLARTLARVGILIGVIAICVGFAVYSSYITRVDTSYIGVDMTSKVGYTLNASVNDILCRTGATPGGRLKDFSLNALQNALSALDGVAYASVTLKGTHVNVIVKAELPKQSFVELSGSQVQAKKRAVITRVIVEGGTAVKGYGDVVNVGDTIIDGYVEYGDARIACQASGYAYGKVYYEKSLFFADDKIVKTYGAQTTQTRLSLFGKTPKMPTSPYEVCETAVAVSDFGFLLPVKIYAYTFREILTEEVQNTLSEEDMKRSVYSSLLTELNQNARVLDVYYDVQRADGGVIVKVTLEAEEQIA